MKIFIFTILAVILVIPQKISASGAKPPVVVELFSSVACPACPPADSYMGKLAKAGQVIALSCHVDYFKARNDNLGKFFCTKRQTVYMHQMGNKSLFTPQMVINGHRAQVGTKTSLVAQEIVKARSDRLSAIQINKAANGVYNFTLPTRKFDGYADLILMTYDRPHDASYRGRKNLYYNVVHHTMPLGTWGGNAINRAVFPAVSQRHAGFVILAQHKQSGAILAAGDYRF